MHALVATKSESIEIQYLVCFYCFSKMAALHVNYSTFFLIACLHMLFHVDLFTKYFCSIC
jgi:hypothetical protein